MRKIDSRQLLTERAALFEERLGKRGEYHAGRIPFPAVRFDCALAFHSRRSLLSVSHFLSLQGSMPTPSLNKEGPARCYLNRLGLWRMRGKNPRIRNIMQGLKGDATLGSQLRKTDIDSMDIFLGDGCIDLSINLYGGGFSAVMLPPMHLPIGIPPHQAEEAARLYLIAMKRINACNPTG